MEIIINFSGGKDSTAMLAYICENWSGHTKHVVMADTGWEHEDAISWSNEIVARFGLNLHVVKNPNKNYLSMVRSRGMFPSASHRQCTSDLKRGPIQTWIRRNIEDPLIVNCLGIRAEESPARAKKKVMTRDRGMTNSKRTVWTWNPILHWSETQVRRYLADRDIPLHPVYNYLNRFSCRVCIFHSKRDLLAVKQNDPEAFQIISSLEKDIGFTMNPAGSVEELTSRPIDLPEQLQLLPCLA